MENYSILKKTKANYFHKKSTSNHDVLVCGIWKNVISVIVGTKNFRKLSDAIAKAVVGNIISIVWIFLYDEKNKKLKLESATGTISEKQLKKLISSTGLIGLENENLINKCFLENKFLQTADSSILFGDTLPKGNGVIIQRNNQAKNFVCLPLTQKNKKLGVLVLGLQIAEEDMTAGITEEIFSITALITLILNEAHLEQREQIQFKKYYDNQEDIETIIKLLKTTIGVLDLEQVSQRIVDSIPELLSQHKFIGGMIQLVDDREELLKTYALTNDPKSKRVVKVLPKAITEFKLPLNDNSYRGIRALSTNKIQTTDQLKNFISPPISEAMALVIEKLIGMKSALIVPIEVRGKMLGLLTFVLAKPKSEIKKRDRDLVQTFTSHIGSLIENAKLFAEVQRVNKELEVSNDYLREMDESRSEFISIASHQLRTPLSAVKGYLSLVLADDYGEVSTTIKDVLQRVYLSNERLIRLVNNLLSASRMEKKGLEMEFSDENINKIIAEIVEEFIPLAKDKKIKLEFSQSEEEINLVIDNEKIRQVILNLFDNAIKYTKQGSIILTTDIIEKNSLDKITKEKLSKNNKANKYFRFQIADTGVGIDANEIDTVFEKYVRSKNSEKASIEGTGLGLHICKEIIDHHQGIIWVESEGNKKGSVFYFLLPIIE
ncbi:MAG: GAF domain-containing sensor histidine kinase [bacterium]